ncbi:uncharacterized protein PFL1_04730 [Pseudozyma flocculosa PF-1]|uniref:Uncharacterized protein n=2 Tax=Pseudozyma flocculosa TaxID=84751 RepID=A0A5C3F7M3_9BASI|nr:uncharacterized protein PFL1_04730 [Pseudozyma flocculosa PF-1]EPQ27592.1 hypothetical protein PFL1_04730 [Pseudozyma flocculosa PF-1]SPO39281.1 uncharacterized protein PSFLO_04761 [Pseudozyma flocculosa]
MIPLFQSIRGRRLATSTFFLATFCASILTVSVSASNILPCPAPRRSIADGEPLTEEAEDGDADSMPMKGLGQRVLLTRKGGVRNLATFVGVHRPSVAQLHPKTSALDGQHSSAMPFLTRPAVQNHAGTTPRRSAASMQWTRRFRRPFEPTGRPQLSARHNTARALYPSSSRIDPPLGADQLEMAHRSNPRELSANDTPPPDVQALGTRRATASDRCRVSPQ